MSDQTPTLPFTVTPDAVNIFIDGGMRVIPKTHMNFSKIVKELEQLHAAQATDDATLPLLSRLWYGNRAKRIKRATNRIRILIDVPSYLTYATKGRIKVTKAGVSYNGKPLHDAAADRLMQLVKGGHDVQPLINFIERLHTNPDTDVIDDLFKWMEQAKMPLTPDGKFLAFKKVAADYSSIHTSPNGTKIFNYIGCEVKMKREDVDNDRASTCSRGLHFCGFSYLSVYGTHGESRVVVVEVAPEDVCAIPYDYSAQKGRAWRYIVVGEVPPEEVAHFFKDTPVTVGGSIDAHPSGDYSTREADEDDWEDEEYQDDWEDEYAWDEGEDDEEDGNAVTSTPVSYNDPYKDNRT